MRGNLSDFRQALLQWFATRQRSLPWRTQPSIYKTVVSEFMLQQTQVETVIPFFNAWLHRFPDFHALANAPLDAVLKAWEGLGYYSRARNLHKLAQTLTANAPSPSAIQFPSAAAQWQSLPGIGPYAAAAIASIAQNLPAAVVDGNVVRVLARIFADDTPLKPHNATKHFAQRAQTLLDPQYPGPYNEAIMELGATTCRKANPACLTCPVNAFCASAFLANASQRPNLIRKPTQHRTLHRLLAVRNQHILLTQYPNNAKRLANVFELPEWPSQLPIPSPPPNPASLKRGIANESITEFIHPLPPQATPPELPNLQWVPLAHLQSLTLSAPHKRFLNARFPSPPPHPQWH